MAEFKTIANEHVRMCKFYDVCNSCPLNREEITGCSAWVLRHPEEAESIIKKWSIEHPIVTNRMKFREVFGMDLVITGNTNEWLDQEYKEK